MKKRIAGCKGIYERIKDAKDLIGLKSFEETPTSQAKISQMPVCFMNYGVDVIIKKGSRSASSRTTNNINSLEVILEIVALKESDVISIFQKLRRAVLVDPNPALDSEGGVDHSVSISEERKEGPFGYGIPNTEVFVFVITLIYPDEI